MKTLKDILTARRFYIAREISLGYTNREIARKIGITEQAVKNHTRAIYENAGCSQANRGEMIPRVEMAVRYAIEEERGLYKSV